MRLYAAGFNAWNQLRLDRENENENQSDSEPDDLSSFTRVLEAESISNLRPFFTCTTVTTENGQLLAGLPPEHGVRDSCGELGFVEALNGQVVACDDAGILYQYASAADYYRSGTPCLTFSGIPGIVQMAAYDSGFCVLTSTGQVWTWGDSRFPECLGRTITKECPADLPGRVTCLENLPTGPIVKIAAGGYVLSALTHGHDLYCWGGYAGRKRILGELTGEPEPIVVVIQENGSLPDDENSTDILDIAMGEAHMIVLMADGQVCAIGSNANGQLGLDPNSQPVISSSWVRVHLPLSDNERVVGVAAGPRCSFVLSAG